MSNPDLKLHHTCPRDNENMQSLKRKLQKQTKKVIGSWKKADMKICPKCKLIMIFNKNVKYVIYPETEVVRKLQ